VGREIERGKGRGNEIDRWEDDEACSIGGGGKHCWNAKHTVH
jgi:hypothetical protein